MALQATGRRAIERGVSTRTDFRHGNVSGRWFDYPSDIERGQLSRDVMLPDGVPVYVVFSYQTPIAWWTHLDGWTMPAVRYSVTTSNHQSAVRVALTGQEVSV